MHRVTAISFLLLGLCNSNVQAQKGVESNLWLSGQFNYQGKKNQHIADASWRTDDYFIREQKQQLLRYTYLARIRESSCWIGGGIAGFRNYQTKDGSWRPEVRPFIQAQYTFEHKQLSVRIRYRNELRLYQQPWDQADRNRLQLQIQQRISNSPFKFQAFAEGFYTLQNQYPWEFRSGVGALWSISPNWQVNIMYQLQRQQKLPGVNQHILLLLFTYQIKK